MKLEKSISWEVPEGTYEGQIVEAVNLPHDRNVGGSESIRIIVEIPALEQQRTRFRAAQSFTKDRINELMAFLESALGDAMWELADEDGSIGDRLLCQLEGLSVRFTVIHAPPSTRHAFPFCIVTGMRALCEDEEEDQRLVA